MRYPKHLTTRPAGRLLAALVLLAGVSGTSILLAAGPAGATTCSPDTPTSGSCTTGGSLDLTGGSLSLEAPATLSWSATLTGLDQQLTDLTDTTYTAVDPTGSGDGWTVTAAVTTFTATGPVTLADQGFVTTGSTSSETATTAPSDVCATGSSCTLPTNGLSYPVDITTGASPTPFNIYDAAVSTGLGAILIGSTVPVGWWLNVPANAAPGTYTSTITLAISSGPPA